MGKSKRDHASSNEGSEHTEKERQDKDRGSHKRRRQKDKKSKDRRPADQLLGNAEKLVGKLQRWVTRGKASKLDELLKSVGPAGSKPLMAICNSQGQSLLHQACHAGHLNVVQSLLRHGADARARDQAGNTPAHTAALSPCTGQLLIVTHVLQAEHPPDIDATNKKGQSISQLVDELLGSGAPKASTQAHQRADSESESEGAAWRRRLAEEAGYDDEEGGGGFGYATGVEDARWGAWSALGREHRYSSRQQADVEAGSEDDEAWADRLWAEMQGRRRAAALASSKSFAASMKEAWVQQEAEQAAAVAAAAARLRESERVLRQEQARDRAWRERNGGVPRLEGPGPQPQPAGYVFPPPPPLADPVAARAAYETRWLHMEAQLAAGKALHVADVAWPLPAGCLYTVDNLRELLLGDAEGPADIRQRLRTALMRWHPDKFAARTAGRLGTDAATVVLRVKEISQALTSLLSS